MPREGGEETATGSSQVATEGDIAAAATTDTAGATATSTSTMQEDGMPPGPPPQQHKRMEEAESPVPLASVCGQTPVPR